MEFLESELELACLELSMHQDVLSNTLETTLARKNLQEPLSKTTTSSPSLSSLSLSSNASPLHKHNNNSTLENRLHATLEYSGANIVCDQPSTSEKLIDESLFKNTLSEMMQSPKIFQENTKHQLLFNEHMKNSLTSVDCQYERLKKKQKKSNKSIKTDTLIMMI